MSVGRSGLTDPVAVYRVGFYVDGGGGVAEIHTWLCHSRQQARDFALTMLLNAYLVVEEPVRARRRYWCELVPGRWVGGQWVPDPGVGGQVDAVFLDGETGEITVSLEASMRRAAVEQTARGHPAGAAGHSGRPR